MNYKLKDPFTFADATFAPKDVSEDFHSDGTKKSTGNAFDLNKKKEDRPADNKNHDVKKLSTGTAYTRKSSTFDKEDAPAGKDTVASEKRGRGRPSGKYGSYKKKIAEAIAAYSVVEEEQLDELSKKTLGSYIKIASDSRASHGFKAGQNYTKDSEKFDKHLDKALTRKKGINSAVKRLTKEETEQLDELSKKTLGSYVKKATDDIRSNENNSGYREGRSVETKNKDDKKKHDIIGAKNMIAASRRARNVNKAVDKLTKESFEQGARVQVANKVGLVEHVIGSDVFILFEDGIKKFNNEYVSLVPLTTDNTLLEGVSWDRWDASHDASVKEQTGTWLISLDESGYRYGQVEGKDFFKVKGNGMDAAEAAQKLAQESGQTAYILEAFTPETEENTFTFANIAKSALGV